MGDTAKRNFILSVAAILLVFGLIVGGFYAYRTYIENQAQKNRILYLHDDGTFAALTPENKILQKNLKENIGKLKQAMLFRDGGQSDAVVLNVIADAEARMWQFEEVLLICHETRVDKIRLSETDNYLWYEIPIALKKHWSYAKNDETLERGVISKPLPIPHEVTGLFDIQLRLSWFDKDQRPMELKRYDQTMDEYIEKVRDGHVVAKIGDRVFIGKDGGIDYPALGAYIKDAAKDFRQPYGLKYKMEMPLIIYAPRCPVLMKDVIAIVRFIHFLGIKDFIFDWPSVGMP
jgi:hypothetical protein